MAQRRKRPGSEAAFNSSPSPDLTQRRHTLVGRGASDDPHLIVSASSSTPPRPFVSAPRQQPTSRGALSWGVRSARRRLARPCSAGEGGSLPDAVFSLSTNVPPPPRRGSGCGVGGKTAAARPRGPARPSGGDAGQGASWGRGRAGLGRAAEVEGRWLGTTPAGGAGVAVSKPGGWGTGQPWPALTPRRRGRRRCWASSPPGPCPPPGGRVFPPSRRSRRSRADGAKTDSLIRDRALPPAAPERSRAPDQRGPRPREGAPGALGVDEPQVMRPWPVGIPRQIPEEFSGLRQSRYSGHTPTESLS